MTNLQGKLTKKVQSLGNRIGHIVGKVGEKGWVVGVKVGEP